MGEVGERPDSRSAFWRVVVLLDGEEEVRGWF